MKQNKVLDISGWQSVQGDWKKQEPPMFILSRSLSCGNCGEVATIESKATCLQCGRMLCEKCGNFCDFHKPDDLFNDSLDDAVIGGLP